MKEIKYFDKLMLPNEGAFYIFNGDMAKANHSFMHVIPQDGTIIRKPDEIKTTVLNKMNVVTIINERIDPHRLVTDEDLKLAYAPGSRDDLRGVKDELCKLAAERTVFLSNDNSEIYGEAFTFYGEYNFTHTYVFDYGILYDEDIYFKMKELKRGDRCKSDIYSSLEIVLQLDPRRPPQKVSVGNEALVIDKGIMDDPNDKYNPEVHKNIYCTSAGFIPFVKRKLDNGNVEDVCMPETYFGPYAQFFIPTSTIKPFIETKSSIILGNEPPAQPKKIIL